VTAQIIKARDELITQRLTEAFRPESLRVLDESHLHEGHAGHRPGGQTHFRIYIVSEDFRGKSRLDRQRLINAALAAEFVEGIHALAIHAAAPGE
jgi:BolA protein